MLKKLIVPVVMVIGMTASSAMAAQYIDIGNTSSEAASGIEFINASGVIRSGIAGGEHTARNLKSEGNMVFEMDCSGVDVNYLTAKLWGSDVSDTMLWVVSAESGNMNEDDTRPPYRNGLVDRRDWVELNTCNATTPQYDGGFIYVTYEIPKIYTEGKSKVKLKIMSTGGAADYADVSVKEQKEASRGIYALWMTQEACFVPEVSDPLCGGSYTENPAKLYSISDTSAMSAKKQEAAKILRESVEVMKSFQIYGGNNYPSYMEGMMTRTTVWNRKSETDEDWKSAFYTSNFMLKQNLTPLNAFEMFAYAYKNADGLYGTRAEQARNELLDRIVKGTDFLCRAQGSNGGFYSTVGWIGGPDRAAAGGNALSGFGLRAVGEGLLVMREYINDDILNEAIDSDADGENDISRREAWINMFEKGAEFMLSYEGAGHAPNQDMAEIITALRFDMAAKSYGGGGVPEGDIKTALDIEFGKEKNLSCSSYWISPKGTILENFGSIQGGYSGDYGSMAIAEASQLAQLAKNYGLNYDEEINKMYRVIDAYYFTGKKKIGTNLYAAQYTEGLTSNRNAYYPGNERYIVDLYAALELENDTALKILSGYFEMRDFALMTSESDELKASNAHFEDNVLDLMHIYNSFDVIMAMMKGHNTEEYNFLMENDSIKYYAFADEMARSVVIKNGDERVYMSLNWRNPLHSVNYYNNNYKNQQRIKANNLARVHSTNSSYDRYGYAAVDTYTSTTTVYENGKVIENFTRYLDGWTYINTGKITSRYSENGYMQALMEMKYGDYTILMNSNNCGPSGTDYNKAYICAELKLGEYGMVPGERYIDLISFKEYECTDENGVTVLLAADGNKFTLQPASTAVLANAENFEDIDNSVNFACEYRDGTVYIENNPDQGTITGEDSYDVYAAEYDSEGRLSTVSKGTLVTERSKDSYQVELEGNAGNDARVFIWKGMEPKFN